MSLLQMQMTNVILFLPNKANCFFQWCSMHFLYVSSSNQYKDFRMLS